MDKLRCVYVYYRQSKATKGKPSTLEPYYVGKGSIRRAYDWVRHTDVKTPPNAEDIHILGKDMTDVEAMQAEVLLIHLFGRKFPKWDKRYDGSGTLLNKTCGGDGPAATNLAGRRKALDNEERFREANPCFSLIKHSEGYYYSPAYPKVRSTTGVWLTKRTPGTHPSGPRRLGRRPPVDYKISERVDEQLPNSQLTYRQKQHYGYFGDVLCKTPKHETYCWCVK